MTALLADSSSDSSSLTVANLEAALREVEPGVMLLAAWILKEVIALDQGISKHSPLAPQCKAWIIGRARLKELASDNDVDLPVELPSSQLIVLLVEPDEQWLSERPAAEALRRYWRLLFFAHVWQELRCKTGGSSAQIEARIEHIGRSGFNEAKFVLRRDRQLLTTASDGEAYALFGATYLEMHFFQPDLLTDYFPSFGDDAHVVETLSTETDPEDVLRRTRLTGAADRQPARTQDDEPDEDQEPASRDEEFDPKLLIAAERAASSGNLVRAAILRQLASAGARENYICAAAKHDLKRLVERLAAALDLDDSEAARWRNALAPLLPRCTDSWWNQEARLLYDLQKACLNHEREIYSVGVVEWLLEGCCRPLRRPQPNERIASICKSLRTALNRIHRARLTAEQREQLAALLHHSLHHIETRLCETLRPAIVESLKAGGLVPQNAVERVAENKVVEELLDGLAHRGFITLSNVRDAIANNQLKFNDIPGPVTFFRGDPLFRIDRRLEDALDGVYHSGEIYLRLFQRVSSIFFATVSGRFITRVFLMPLIGAYIIIAGLDHTLFAVARAIAHAATGTYEPHDVKNAEDLAKVAGKSPWHLPHVEPFSNFFHHEHPIPHAEMIAANVAFIALAVLLLALVNWPPARKPVKRVFVALGHAIAFVFYRAPKWVLDLPLVREFLGSKPVRLVSRYLLKPLFFAAIAWLIVRGHAQPRTQWIVLVAAFIGVSLLLNNAIGRAIEHSISRWVRTVWTHITSEYFVNVFQAILHFFGRRLEDFDRMIYAVDEWLRFREGHPRPSLYAKAILGVSWFYVAYFSRFALNLLVEPQINPIKHFPVVTVSHKLILPQVRLVKNMLPARFEGLAFPILFVIPGIFGFLAWELRSNWMLYRANRSPRLKPVMVGSHGESMARLLRPGLHSGTIPKLFAKLRKAHAQAEEADPASAEAAAHKHTEAVEHVSEAVAHFIQREFVALLNQHPAWKESPTSLTGVTLCVTRVTADIACPSLDASSMQIFFEQRAGWILAGIDAPGWSAKTPPFQARLLSAALLGLYKLAGVDIVKEQVESLFAPTPIAFELSEEALTVWPDRNFEKPLVFSLEDTAPAEQKFRGQQLLLSDSNISRSDWVSVWDVPPKWSPVIDPDGVLAAPKGLPPVRVLPWNGRRDEFIPVSGSPLTSS